MLDIHLQAKTSPMANPKNIVFFSNYRITVLSDRLFRIEMSESKTFLDEATQTVWFRNAPAQKFSVITENDNITIKTDKVVLCISENFPESYVMIDGKELSLTNAENLGGTYRTLDCCDGSFLIDSRLNTRTPINLGLGVVSKNGVAVLDDSSSLVLHDDGTLGQSPERMDLYVFAFGTDYRGAVRSLYDICGRTPIIPRFALGNWWSRYHAYTDIEYLQTMDRLIKRNVPVTVATIDMDWHWSTTVDEHFGIQESGKNDEFHGYPAKGWTGYSWNTDLFPDYREFLNELKERNLHITLNLHPALGVRYFEKAYRQMAEAVGIDPATEQVVAFDFTNDDFINAYFSILHKPYEHNGVDFWWIDWQQGTKTALAGLDPLWALNHYHSLDISKEKDQLILSRYSGIGSHRYPLGFSGDTTISWDSLDYLPYFTYNASNVGYSWWSHDIGGHYAGIKDDELFVRYVQFGVFSPINRLHCTDSRIATKEPSVYMNGTGLIAEEFLRLRHKLIPYLYSASYENTFFGLALCEPLYYEYPNCEESYKAMNEYLFGRQLLCAPITSKGDEKGLSSREVWLPEGHWTDIFTGDEYDGGKYVKIVRWMDTIPVFAKQGGFYVTDGRAVSNNSDEPDVLDVFSYMGSGKYVLYEENCKTEFSAELKDCVQTVLISTDRRHDRIINLHFANVRAGELSVYVDNNKIGCCPDTDGYISVQFNLPACSNARVSVNIVPESKNDKRNRMLHYSMLRINGDHFKRSNLLKTLFECDDERAKYEIENASFLSENEKLRLLEAFYIDDGVKF